MAARLGAVDMDALDHPALGTACPVGSVRLMRKILVAVDHPCFRMTAFRFPEEVSTMVAKGGSVPAVYRNCTQLKEKGSSREAKPLIFLAPEVGLEPTTP